MKCLGINPSFINEIVEPRKIKYINPFKTTWYYSFPLYMFLPVLASRWLDGALTYVSDLKITGFVKQR